MACFQNWKPSLPIVLRRVVLGIDHGQDLATEAFGGPVQHRPTGLGRVSAAASSGDEPVAELESLLTLELEDVDARVADDHAARALDDRLLGEGKLLGSHQHLVESPMGGVGVEARRTRRP